MKRSVFLLLLVLSALSANAQKNHYEQNFDNLKDGDLSPQDGWDNGAPANLSPPKVTSKVKRGAVGKSVEVTAPQEAVRVFDPSVKSGVHFLSIWFRMEDIGADRTLHVYMGDLAFREWAAGPVVRIGSQSGDPAKVGVHDGETVKPVGDIKKGEWQHLFEVFDVDKQRYTVSLDEKVIAKDFSWRNPANHKTLGWLMIGWDAGAALTGYYDDIVFGVGDTLPLSIESDGKLSGTWANLKAVR